MFPDPQRGPREAQSDQKHLESINYFISIQTDQLLDRLFSGLLGRPSLDRLVARSRDRSVAQSLGRSISQSIDLSDVAETFVIPACGPFALKPITQPRSNTLHGRNGFGNGFENFLASALVNLGGHLAIDYHRANCRADISIQDCLHHGLNVGHSLYKVVRLLDTKI